MKNVAQHIAAIKKVAHALGDLEHRHAFVGGAVVHLYIDEPGAEDIRPTLDVDIVVEIASLAELEKLRQQLLSRGFHQAMDENVICRFKCGETVLDVMATRGMGWAPGNPWFEAGFEYLQTAQVDDVVIHILPVAYFLASKFSAIHGRGDDPRTSHDFEDIVYILNNRVHVVEDILDSPVNVKMYLVEEFSNMLHKKEMEEAILAHLEPATQTERYEKLRSKLEEIVEESDRFKK